MSNRNDLDWKKDHQIQLVITSKQRLAVTCNCHRIGTGHNFSRMIGPLEFGEDAIPNAWRLWNQRSGHAKQETFKPNEEMVMRYGIIAPV